MAESCGRAGDAPRCHLDTVPLLLWPDGLKPTAPSGVRKGIFPRRQREAVQVCGQRGAGPGGLGAEARAGTCVRGIQDPRDPPNDALLRAILSKPERGRVGRPQVFRTTVPSPAPARPAGSGWGSLRDRAAGTPGPALQLTHTLLTSGPCPILPGLRDSDAPAAAHCPLRCTPRGSRL